MRPFFNKVFDEAQYEQSMDDLEKVLEKFEKLYLRDHAFIHGDNITIADLLGSYFYRLHSSPKEVHMKATLIFWSPYTMRLVWAATPPGNDCLCVSDLGSPGELDEIYVHFFWRRVDTLGIGSGNDSPCIYSYNAFFLMY